MLIQLFIFAGKITSMQNFAQYLRTLQILFYALLGGQLIIALVLWFNVRPQQTPNTQFVAFDLAIAGIWCMAVAASFFVGKKLIENAREKPDLPGKLGAYRVARIIRYALLEMPVLLCLVSFFFVTSNYGLLLLAAVGIALFATQMPQRNQIVSELDLTESEQLKLDDRETFYNF